MIKTIDQIPHTPTPFGLYSLAGKSLLLGFVLSSLVLVTMILAVVGYDQVVFFFTRVIPKDVIEWAPFILNFSLRGLCERIFNSGGSILEPIYESRILFTGFINSLTVIGVVIFLWSQWKCALLNSHRFQLSFNIGLVSMMLLCPITWAHIFPVLVIPLFALSGLRKRTAALDLWNWIELSIFVILLPLAFLSPMFVNDWPWCSYAATTGIIFVFFMMIFNPQNSFVYLISILISIPCMSIGRLAYTALGMEKLPLLFHLLFMLPTVGLIFLCWSLIINNLTRDS